MSKKQRDAIMVLLRTPHIETYLAASDPKALEQCRNAVEKPTRDTDKHIWLCNFTPKFCPNCGEPMAIMDNVHLHKDFRNHVSFCCMECNTHLQRATNTTLLNAADESNGDLASYAELK